MKDKIKFLDAFPPEWWSDIDRNRNVFEDIYYTVRAKIDNVLDFFRHIMFFCENIIKFRHILWNDRDWDYAYILDILPVYFLCMHVCNSSQTCACATCPRSLICEICIPLWFSITKDHSSTTRDGTTQQ